MPEKLSYYDLILKVTETIKSSKSIILTTHRNSDGDGIGSAVALYWAFKQMGINAHFAHVDPIPSRYNFLLANVSKMYVDNPQWTPDSDAILIVTDTNQGSLCDPIYSQFKKSQQTVIFIDHHVAQKNLDPSDIHFIHTEASSTGEIAHSLIANLNINLTDDMATAIYTSLTFDTQAFKLLRNSVRSHQIAAELASKNIRTDFIQRELFATWTIEKLKFLSELISQANYSHQAQVAHFYVSQQTLKKYNLSIDDISDVIDMFTLVKTIKLCYGLIESTPQLYKLSVRSIESDMAYNIAQCMGGGGHAGSAGAWIENTLDNVQKQLHIAVEKNLKL